MLFFKEFVKKVNVPCNDLTEESSPYQSEINALKVRI